MSAPLEMVADVATVMDSGGVEGVFAGGAILPLLVDDLVASELRPTFDVDVIVQASSYGEYRSRTEPFLRAGFGPGTEDGDPICRFRRAGVAVDIMATPFPGLGTDNPWFEIGLRTAQVVELPGGRSIRVLTPSVFLATKIAAFEDRGRADVYASKDFEDIVALIEGRPQIVEEIECATPEVRDAVAGWCRALLARPDARDALSAHTTRASGPEGWTQVADRIKAIASKSIDIAPK